MTHHLSSDHYIEVMHEDLRWTVVVTEFDGRFTCGKLMCNDRNQYRYFSQHLRKTIRDAVSDKAVKFCKERYVHQLIRQGGTQ